MLGQNYYSAKTGVYFSITINSRGDIVVNDKRLHILCTLGKVSTTLINTAIGFSLFTTWMKVFDYSEMPHAANSGIIKYARNSAEELFTSHQFTFIGTRDQSHQFPTVAN